MPNASGYIPEEIAVILRTQGHSKLALDKANAWVIADTLDSRPELSKWDKGARLEAMKALERRIEHGYRLLGMSDEPVGRLQVGRRRGSL